MDAELTVNTLSCESRPVFRFSVGSSLLLQSTVCRVSFALRISPIRTNSTRTERHNCRRTCSKGNGAAIGREARTWPHWIKRQPIGGVLSFALACTRGVTASSPRAARVGVVARGKGELHAAPCSWQRFKIYFFITGSHLDSQWL